MNIRKITNLLSFRPYFLLFFGFSVILVMGVSLADQTVSNMIISPVTSTQSQQSLVIPPSKFFINGTLTFPLSTSSKIIPITNTLTSTPIPTLPPSDTIPPVVTHDVQAIYDEIQKRIENAKRLQQLMQEKSTTILNATAQELASINEARNNQTIVAEVNVVNQIVQTTSINSNVLVQTNNTSPDSLSISVSASSQTGPKILVVNLAVTTINVANLKDLGVMYDGMPIPPASNIDSILHAKSTDNPSFAIVVTQSGAQILILIPHFSTHTITITNMSKVIPAVPEFSSLAGMIIIISIIGVVTISRICVSKNFIHTL